jgi:hypothetical protein
MADILIDTQTPPAAPAAGSGLLYIDSLTKQGAIRNDTGRVFSLPGAIQNQNVADQALAAADTYVTGSNLAIPAHLLQVGTKFRWRFVLTKTAAGVAAPVWIVRVGVAGTVADAAILTFTQVALQTAAIDAATVDITAVLRNVGAAGVLAGGLRMNHVLAATGFSTLTMNVQQVTSAGFVTTVANSIVGVSANGGAASAWTVQVVDAEAFNI